MTVNKNRICFIICTNDEIYLKECFLYIEQLEVPDCYEVDKIAIKDASSMSEGYNKAMKMSDAKYKIYLHQDILITNKKFIFDVLDIFKSDMKIGMIGIVGNRSIPINGAPFCEQYIINRRVGCVYCDGIFQSGYSLFGETVKPCEDVCVIDGCLMATQYDLPWREDLFKGWDFYDCSQSMEFIKAGYRVVVPYMEMPWCLHDNDILNMDNYEKWRQVFAKEYSEIYYKWTDAGKLIKEFRLNKTGLDDGKMPLLIMMHNQPAKVKRCIENILKYCNVDEIGIVVIDCGGLDDRESEWVRSLEYLTYVNFSADNMSHSKIINTTVKLLDINNDFMILDSALWAEYDFISNIKSIVENNADIATASPLFNCDEYESLFGSVIDENLKEKFNFCSDIYDAMMTQPYAIYIKWELWKKTDGFCELYISPYMVLMDFQLRVLKNGYRNIIALNTLINTDEKINCILYEEEMTLFRHEWGIHYVQSSPNKRLLRLVEEIKDEPINNILEVGCASGFNLMGLKNIFPNAGLYGLELSDKTATIAGYFANVKCGNIETDGIPFEDVKFDVIIFGDVLEHLRNPEETIRMCKEHLSENGRIVCSIPNVQHISVLNQLIHGRFTYTEAGLLDKTHIHLFTKIEIIIMFQNAGYSIESIAMGFADISDEDNAAIDKLKSAFPEINEQEMKTFQYLVRARKKNP